MKLLINIFAMSCFSLTVAGNGVNTDSLWTIWTDHSVVDSVRLNAIYTMGWDGFINSNPDSAYALGQIQFEYASEKGMKQHMAAARNLQGSALYYQGQMDEAFELMEEGVNLFESIGEISAAANILSNMAAIYLHFGNYSKAGECYNHGIKMGRSGNDLTLVANSEMGLGIVNKKMGKYALAMESFKRSLRLFRKIGDYGREARALMNIGNVYSVTDDDAAAIDYYMRSLELAEKVNDKTTISKDLHNLGGANFNLGHLAEAQSYLDRCLKVQRTIGDKGGEVLTLQTLGQVAREMGEFEKGEQYYRQSLQLTEAEGWQLDRAFAYIGLGELALKQARPERAKENGERAIQLAMEMGDVESLKASSHLLYEAHKWLGNEGQALKMHEAFLNYRDSIENEKNVKTLAQFEAQLEYEKQAVADSLKHLADLEQKDLQREVEVAQAETERNIYISGGAAVLMLSFLFFQRRHNRNRLLLKEQEANYQKELLHATINSQENERRRIARDLHDEVGAMLSAIKLQLKATGKKLQKIAPEDPTENAVSMVDETITNVRRISKDLLPPTLEEFGLAYALEDLAEKIEQASGIKVNTNLSPTEERMGLERELSLYRVIQEMANNAMKHAEATEFSLTMKEENGRLELAFSDNGKGFDLEKVKRSKDGKTGLGLKNLENRVGAAGGSMTFSSKLGKGTTLHVKLLTSSKKAQAA